MGRGIGSLFLEGILGSLTLDYTRTAFHPHPLCTLRLIDFLPSPPLIGARVSVTNFGCQLLATLISVLAQLCPGHARFTCAYAHVCMCENCTNARDHRVILYHHANFC